MTSINLLINQIENGQYDNAFSKLYCTKEQESIYHQRKRYLESIKKFAKLYGDDRQVCIYSAPGRTEIGGNHTDHNNGIVMAAAVNLDIIAIVSLSENMIVRVTSKGFDKEDNIDLTNLNKQQCEIEHSASLIRGIAAAIKEKDGAVGGFDAYTTSDVLRGSGLSSSAAFEVIIGAIFNSEFNNNKFTPIEIAQMSQYAENVYFDKPSGLMDQMACSVGSAITIDFKTEGKPIVEKVEFNLDKYDFSLCITDTKGSHAGLTNEYAAIRLEMESIARHFGKKVLREVNEIEFIDNIAVLRKNYGDRAVLRAIHFYADCRRAKNICAAVREDRFNDFISLIIDGGHSSFEYNQNVYSVNNPKEQGLAIGVAISQRILAGKGAWRLQGGGFAGTIQAFVPNAMLNEYKCAIDKVFGEGSCHVLSVRNFGAIQVNSYI